MPRDPQYLTIQEAARASGLSEKAIRRRVERGTIESVVQGTRRVIPRSALDAAGYVSGPAQGATDLEALERLQASVDSLTRRMDALEVWVLRSLNEMKG